MARRRLDDGMGDEAVRDEEERAGGGLLEASPGGGGGRVDEFGNVVPDFTGDPNYPTPFVDYQPDEIAGTTERGIDLKGPRQTPTTTGLPQGVSVNDSMGDGYDGGATQDTPAMPREPSPVAAQSPNPMMANATQGQGPTRRSRVNPAIFGENRNPMLHGRAGGLMGGGLGAVGGGEPSGPLQPSEMFMKLLQLFQQQ